MEKIICPHCGSDMVISNFDYDTSKCFYECEACGHQFSENDIVYCDECGEQITEDERIDYNGMVFCSKDCLKEYLQEND